MITDNNAPFIDYDELEVILPDLNKFLCVIETLSRIGISSRNDKTLYQSCHILHKQGRYFIKHFKEMFAMDGYENTMEEMDIQRRNRIAMLLDEWKLVEVIDKSITGSMCPMSFIRVVGFKDKSNWTLIPKYVMGRKDKVEVE